MVLECSGTIEQVSLHAGVIADVRPSVVLAAFLFHALATGTGRAHLQHSRVLPHRAQVCGFWSAYGVLISHGDARRHKLAIVGALQSRGAVVAMTGAWRLRVHLDVGRALILRRRGRRQRCAGTAPG